MDHDVQVFKFSPLWGEKPKHFLSFGDPERIGLYCNWNSGLCVP